MTPIRAAISVHLTGITSHPAFDAYIVDLIALYARARIDAGLAIATDARLGTIAEEPVVAIRITQAIDADVVGLVAKLTGARVAAGLAIQNRIADFGSVAEERVSAGRVIGDVVARIGRLIARIDRTGDPVVAVHGRACLATQEGIAGLGPVAVEPVRTGRVVRYVVARVGRFVARVDRADDAVVAVDGGTGLANAADTGFRSIAVQTIVTVAAAKTIDARVGAFVAHLPRTRIAAALAVQHGIADFRSIAEQSISASPVVGHVVARISRLIARIDRAGDAIVAVHRRAGLATQGDMASFRAVAVQTIVTRGIVGDVVTRIGALVT